MKLHAILNWYDESPTWLAGCVASLSKIGVEHLIAVDGRYPHFNVGAPVRSPIDQADAILSAAEGIGIGVTLFKPTDVSTEAEQRTLAFALLEAHATRFDDWALVIDADEIIVEGTPTVRDELASVGTETHCAAARVTNVVDPYADPSPDNEVNERTLEIHQKLPVPQTFVHLQSRFWRVMRDMHCRTTHYSYTGTDAAGVIWNIRPDVGVPDSNGLPSGPVEMLQTGPTILHRKNTRTHHRQSLKADYYTLRDELGIEKV